METKKKVLALILGIPLLLAASTVIYYLATWTDPASGLPPGKASLRAASFQQLLEDTATLEAGDQALAAGGLTAHKGPLLAWTAEEAVQSSSFGFLFQQPVYLVVLEQGNFLAVTDLGWKSLLARFLVPGYPAEDTPHGTMLRWSSPKGAEYFLLFSRNLMALSPSRETLLTWARENNPETAPEKKPSVPAEGYSFDLPREDFLNQLTGSYSGKSLLVEGAPGELPVHMRLDSRRVEVEIPLSPGVLFDGRGKTQDIWNLLPEDTYFAVSLSLDLRKAASLVTPSLKDFPTFPWAGAETGFFYHSGSPDPLFFVKIKDPALWKKEKAVLTDGEKGLLRFTGPLKELLTALEHPDTDSSFLEYQGFLIFTGESQGLKESLFTPSKGLSATKEFSALREGRPLQGPLTAYADLDRKTPVFLSSETLMFRILRLYSRSLLHWSGEEAGLSFRLSGLKGRSALIRTFTGFPKLLPQGGSSGPFVLKGSRPGSFLLGTSSGNTILLQDPLSAPDITWQMPENSQFAPDPQGQGLYIWDATGTLDFRRFDGASLETFPRQIGGSGRITAQPVPGGVMIFRDKQADFLSTSDPRLSWSLTFPHSIAFPGYFRLGYGTVVLADPASSTVLLEAQGALKKGWPKAGWSNAPLAPLLLRSGADVFAVRMDSQGKLEVRDLQGDILPGFPKEIPGNYPAPPSLLVTQDREFLVLADSQGSLTIVDPLTGDPVLHKTLEALGSDSRLVVYDLDRNGRQEILAYGAGGQIWAWNDRLEPLPDFPVMGTLAPQFWDLDGDGFLEMITGDGERRIYVYTLRF